MTTDTKLLPCPFCGANAHFEVDDARWEWVECESCGMQSNRRASLMEDCKPMLADAWNTRAERGTPALAAPWRSAVLDLIDECPGLTMEQDRWLSRRVKELDFESTPQPIQPQAGAVPLTPEQVAEIADAAHREYDRIVSSGQCAPRWVAVFAHLLEVHHGIKGGQHVGNVD